MKKKNKKPKSIYLKSIVILTIIGMAFGFSDAFYSFLVPIAVQRYFNNVLLVGLFIGIASIFAIFADAILGFISSKVSYLSFLVVGLIITALTPSLLLVKASILSLVLLMFVWGVYHEFIKIAFFNYSARYHNPKDQSRIFGILYEYYEIPNVFGPIFAAFAVAHFMGLGYMISLLPIFVGLILVKLLSYIHSKYEKPYLTYSNKHKFDAWEEFINLKKTYKKSFIPLIGVLIIYTWTAYVWTVVPIEATKTSYLDSAILLAAFTIPLTFMQSYSGKIADKYGRNITSVIGLTIGSIATLIYGLQTGFLPEVILALIATSGFSIASPAVLGQLSFRSLRTSAEVGESAGLQRVMANLGYILGPLLGGILANISGITKSFMSFGLILIITTLLINLLLTHIHITGLLKKRLVIEYDM